MKWDFKIYDFPGYLRELFFKISTYQFWGAVVNRQSFLAVDSSFLT